MKYRFAAALAALSTLMLAAPVQAADQNLSDWSVTDMKAILPDAGAKVITDGVGLDGTPYVTAQSADGLRYRIVGSVCTGVGKAQRCKGAQLMAVFDLPTRTAVAKAREFSSAVAVIDAQDEDTIRVFRYVLFDEGISRGNLVANLKVFSDVAMKVWEGL